MKQLYDLVSHNEEWLIERILYYAKKTGYSKYTSTLKEAWRLSINELSKALLTCIDQYDHIPELSPDEDYTKNPSASFGILEAQKHRSRGINFGMFLSLMKYYKRSYIDLIKQEEFERKQQERYILYIEGFYDLIELGFSVEWTSIHENQITLELQNTNRFLTNEKNKYLTIFESLSHPAILLNANHQIDNMNHAAMTLFHGESTPGSSYYGKKREQKEFPHLSKELEIFAHEEKQRVSFEKQIETQDGMRFFQISIKKMLDISEKFAGMIILFDDITEKKNAENILQQYATIDSLTKIYNRRHFSELSELEIKRANRYRHPLSLLMIDADHFKIINDTYGHETGDNTLEILATVCNQNLRKIDILGRLGGEEFAVLLPETDFEGAKELADRLRRSVEETIIPVKQDSFNITISIGLVTYRRDITDLQSILKKADEMMYLAKSHGRNRVESFLDY